MKVLFFGDRGLTEAHMPVMRAIAFHASLEASPPLGPWLDAYLKGYTQRLFRVLPESEPLILIHGAGPGIGSDEAEGADWLAERACKEMWPEGRRRLRRYPAEDFARDESWGRGAYRRNRAMAEAKPDRAYCVHRDLDGSKGSAMMARFLHEARISIWHVQVNDAGEVLTVEER